MANSYQIIDEKTWERAMHCMVFRNSVEPAFCVTFEADITNYKRMVKEQGLSFTLAMVYAVCRCANKIEAFRYRFVDGQVVLYDKIDTAFTYLNKETDFILKYFDVDAPPVINDVSGENIILVDHNLESQAVAGIENACVMEIIDHHNLFGDIKAKKPVFYMTMPVGSTSTIIWLCYRQNNVKIDRKMAGIMFGAILSDTDNLRSSNTTNLDVEAAENLQNRR